MIANVPEDAAIANLRDKGTSRNRRLLLSASFAIPVIVAAVLAFFVLRSQPQAWKLIALVVAAGLLTVAAVEDVMSEAHESREESRGSLAAFIGGFAVFTFLSAGLGESPG